MIGYGYKVEGGAEVDIRAFAEAGPGEASPILTVHASTNVKPYAHDCTSFRRPVWVVQPVQTASCSAAEQGLQSRQLWSSPPSNLFDCRTDCQFGCCSRRVSESTAPLPHTGTYRRVDRSSPICA